MLRAATATAQCCSMHPSKRNKLKNLVQENGRLDIYTVSATWHVEISVVVQQNSPDHHSCSVFSFNARIFEF